jgi:hypothetical protein
MDRHAANKEVKGSGTPMYRRITERAPALETENKALSLPTARFT